MSPRFAELPGVVEIVASSTEDCTRFSRFSSSHRREGCGAAFALLACEQCGGWLAVLPPCFLLCYIYIVCYTSEISDESMRE